MASTRGRAAVATLVTVAIGLVVAIGVIPGSWPVVSDRTPLPRSPATSSAATGGADAPAESAPPVSPAPQPVPAAQLSALPDATTFGTLPDSPTDPDPDAAPSGLLVRPLKTVPVYTEPDGVAFAAVPPSQLGSDTWLPVVAERSGWLHVLLPARPNGATGWLPRSDDHELARSDYLIRVDRDLRTITLDRDGERVGRWPAGIGKPETPTPTGRTFVLANIRDTEATFSDVVLPLGAHSDTYTTYGGGPGTVGIHTWPAPDGIGTASSDGCVRVPQAALDPLSERVPLGTPVLIS